MEFKIENIGSSVYWIMMAGAVLAGLLYLAVWSNATDSLQGIILFSIFFSMVITGIILSKFQVFNAGTFSMNSLSFYIGFIIYAIIGSLSRLQGSVFSVFAVSENVVYSTIVSRIPIELNFIMTSVVIPIAEEFFWMFGMTFVLVSVLNLMGMKWSIFKNPILQIVTLIIIQGLTFGIFHVSKVSILFIIATVLFRAITVVLAVGDNQYDIIPVLAIGFSFSFGAHIGNNWGVFGLSKGVSILLQNFFTFGGLFLAFMGAQLLGALNQIFLLVQGVVEK